MRKLFVLLATAAFAGGCHTRPQSVSSVQIHVGEGHSDEGHNHSGHVHKHDGHSHGEHDHAGSAPHNHEENISDEHTHEGSNPAEDAPGSIRFSKQQADMARLEIQTVTSGTFCQVIKTSGQIRAAQGDEMTVVATTAGTVLFANPSLTEGTSINKGETLITISARNMEGGDPAVRAKAEYEAAEKDFKRAGNLIGDKIVSAKNYEQIRMRYENAKTAYEALAGQAAPGGVKVVSPMHGYLRNRLVSQGEYVVAGQPVAIIVQNGRLQLRAEVPEKYFKDLPFVAGANFATAYDPEVHRLSELNGSLISCGKVSDASSFYIPVIFEFDNIGTIIPGSFAEIWLLTRPLADVIAVPVTAVTEEQGLYFVYLQTGAETYQKQEITPGHTDGNRLQVLSGLKEGDKIVTKGVYQVKLAANSGVIPEGHSHAH